MGKINFDVDAYTARLIGRENVSRLDSAVLELVKNTYDADASICILYYESSTKTLYLADNGSGMSEGVIRKHWMTIGNSSKKAKYVSSKGRIQTGAKGIGRFALDRIGDRCSMYTKSSHETLLWSVDWSSFSDGKPITSVAADLDTVEFGVDKFVDGAVNPNFVKLIREKCGDTCTVFRVSPVRDEWDEKLIQNLRHNLATLIPQELSDVFSIFFFEENTSIDEAHLVMKITETLCDYKVAFDVDGDSVHVSIARNEFDFKQNAPKIMLEAGFTNEDEAFFSGQEIKKTFSFSEFLSGKKQTVPNRIGAFRGVFLFSKKAIQIGDKERYYYRHTRNLNLPWEGIRIFRDNFRVRPYGDPDSSSYDWLLLSNRKAKSPAAPSHPTGKWRVGADQICGTVLISRTNVTLPDQANREGFVETPEFHVLKRFLTKVIELFERDRQYVFRKLNAYFDETHPTAQYEYEIKQASTRHEENNQPKENNQVNSHVEPKRLPGIVGPVVEAHKAQAVIDQKKETIGRLEQELQLLRALATVGIVTNTYVHEIRDDVNKLAMKLVLAKEALEYDGDVPQALHDIDQAIFFQRSFGSWFKVTIETVKKDRRTMKKVNLKQLLSNLKAAWESTCENIDIHIDCEDIHFKCFAYEMDSIFNNLIANSNAAFKSSNTKSPQISLSVCMVDEGMRISYQDNGPGLSAKYKVDPDLILEAMETDKVDKNGDPIGTGMGMWIIRSIVDDYHGSIDLTQNATDDKGFHIDIVLKGGR